MTTRRLRFPKSVSAVTVVALTAGLITVVSAGNAAASSRQPDLGSRSTAVVTQNGYRFRDLDGSGDLTPYEDWRLSPAKRVEDLLGRMSLEDKAGLMVHSELPTANGTYNIAALTPLVQDKHIRAFITRLSAEPKIMAEQNNALQALAEQQPLGIPVSISSDPRNGFSVTAGQTVAGAGTTAFPDFIGMAATGSTHLTKQFGDITREEYRAVGIHTGLSPQADIATEPRWTRINGTFGSDSAQAKRLVQAMITGMQGSPSGLTRDGVAAVVKHWAGYGAQENGYDSHYYYGRYATFPGNNFKEHLVPYEGAFRANVAGVMPTYSILKDLVYKGHPVEQVGAGFNEWLLQDLLRGTYGFDGVILSDWGITGDCPQACLDNRPPSFFIGPWGVGMPWGVENLTVQQRYALTITAGVDQIGGADQPANIVTAVNNGGLTAKRIDEASRRILLEKFKMGLFENPYVDPQRAAAIVGNEKYQAVGDRAQAESLTLLTNNRNLLPVSDRRVKTVYLSGVSAEAATVRGLVVTTDPGAADLAVVRLSDPRGGADLTDLNFTGSEADYTALQAAVNAGTPVVAVPKLDRPLVLTNVVDRATAVLANYGVSDEVLLETLFGERSPRGNLPFELPRSMDQVERQLEDVPDDIPNPLFPPGYGKRYR
jgi:beta-glucosidase